MLKLREIMTTDVVTLSPDTTLRDAAELLSRHHVSGAPVLRDGGIVGVLSTSDLLEFAGSDPGVPSDHELESAWADVAALPASEEAMPAGAVPPDAYFTDAWASVGEALPERPPSIEGPEWSALDEHSVEEVMTRKLYCLAPDVDVTAAASLMDSAHIHRVIVAEAGQLLGVVTATDIARAAAAHKVHTRTYVFGRHTALDQREEE